MQCKDPWKPLAMKTANSKKEKDGKMIWQQSSNTESTKKASKNPHVVPNRSGFDFSAWHKKKDI